MSSIGETLRRERQRRNLDLDQISRELKISSRFLEAIEAERFDQLPAGVFAKSFVRQYATMLGLDAEELVAEVQRTLTPEPPPGAPLETPKESLGIVPEMHLPRGEDWQTVGDRRNWSSSLPALALVVVVMLVCSGLYAFWQRERHPAQAPAPVETAKQAAPQQAQAAAPQVQPEPQAQQPPQQSEAQPPASAPSATPAPPPAQPAPTVAAANPPAAQAAQPDQAEANRTAPNPSPVAAGSVKVEIAALEPVWVLARANGKYLFSGTLDANQTRSMETNGTLLLRVGNAGGLNITLNGKPIGPVGPKGQIRDIQFTSGGFQILAAPKPPSPPGD